MSNDEKRKAIIDSVHKACPETMELKFGCILKSRTSGVEIIFLGCERWRGHDKIDYWKAGYSLAEFPFYALEGEKISEPHMQTGTQEYVRDMIASMNKQDEDFEIIGSELWLEHLFRALKEINWAFEINNPFAYFCIYHNEKLCSIRDSYARYDLTLSLEGNLKNDELVEFLFPLLCND